MKRTYRIYGAAEPRSAELQETAADTYRVTLDGKTYDVQFRDVDGALATLQFSDGRVLEVPYYRQGRDVHVGMRSRNYAFEVLDQMQAVLKERSRSAAGGDGVLKAQMPGRVIKVLVKPGDAVTIGQGLLIVEAMKMENELKAQIEGTVGSVNVEVGKTVETGDTLLKIEPTAA